MDATYYTIGMAGHIDHGKTTLTKALTNIDTDRLKEEKERNISIELGYAPLQTKDGTHVSVVDVPGHERFVRQMIAGVAGIDLVVLVIAADEGVMPQTKEHVEILEFLGVKRCIVAVSKIDRVDEELLELVGMDINETLAGTIFEDAPMVYVDSLSGKGVEELKESIFEELKSVENRDRYGSFRLPIDQVFSVHGKGTIVRGTIYEGIVGKSSQLIVLPSEKKVKARNIQVHREDVEEARAGQRTAINLGGIDREEIKRGDVLVASDHFLVTNTIDVSLRFVDDMRSPIKQRSPVKVHVGTSEVMGRIVFFDRNDVQQTDEEVLCQLRLDEEVVVRRGDRFILRRPTPVETIGGGWVIEPKGEKYRFGEPTIHMLQKKKEGTPEDLVADALRQELLLNKQQLIQVTSLDEADVDAVLDKEINGNRIISAPGGKFALMKEFEKAKAVLTNELAAYHEKFSMRLGLNKAELVQTLNGKASKKFGEYIIQTLLDQDELAKTDQFIRLASFQPHLPKRWRTRMEEVIHLLQNDGLAVKKWEDYLANTPFSQEEADDFKNYLIQSQQVYRLTDELLVHRVAFEQAAEQLKQQTDSTFDLKDAKDVWGVSRKYLIPLLELLDQFKFTKRDETKRHWL